MTKTLIVEPRPIGHSAFYLSLITKALGRHNPQNLSLLAPASDSSIQAQFQRQGIDPRAFEFHQPSGGTSHEIFEQATELTRRHDFARVFFAYLDEFLPHLLASGFPAPVSGIWFHPYSIDSIYRWMPPVDKRLRKRGKIHRALRHPPAKLSLEKVFFLDPVSVGDLSRVNPSIRAAHLPDPWENLPSMKKSEARQHFGLPNDRRIFLHIGSSEKRKGLADVLTAFENLSEYAGGSSKRPLLLRVGKNDRLRPRELQRLSALASKGMAVVEEGFVRESDFVEYFSAADWVLLPYRSFRFSSGILSNAIASKTPVIAPDHGLVGRTVDESSLGLLFRHRSSRSLLKAIQKALCEPPPTPHFQQEKLCPEHFIAALNTHLNPP